MSGVALVTGGSRGIGAATVLKLASQGFNVCVNFLSHQKAADQVVAQALEMGVKAIAVQADVSVESDVMRLFETVDVKLGVLDALINNVGVVPPRSRFVDMDLARFERTMHVNVTSAFLCSRAAIQRMSTEQGGKGGVIVNVSSAAARLGSAGEYVDYASSKGALDTMTMGLAKELAPFGIRVNGVRPGFIETDIHEAGRLEAIVPTLPLQRAGTPDEVANAIAFLVGHESSYCTGTFIDCAGGR